jgi:2,3,4,5-tetrahydropyridine-2-carboxylate N-succinyltransferase
MQHLQELVENAFEKRRELTPSTAPLPLKTALEEVLALLDSGKIRVAEKQQDQWITHSWIKKAILLYFCTHDSAPLSAGYTQFFDKVPLKFTDYTSIDWEAAKIRIVPHAVVRKGVYLAPNTIVMPAYINLGAYIDSGTLVDTWATVGSCAQIGKNVHLSGGVGIGGVLEPPQANPTIIEDDCFIGARSEIVEGVIVEEGAVISMGVYIGQSTPIYNRMTGETTYGRIPKGAVVVPGNLPSRDNKYSLYCACIVKQVDKKTREKVSLNELLRNIE